MVNLTLLVLPRPRRPHRPRSSILILLVFAVVFTFPLTAARYDDDEDFKFIYDCSYEGAIHQKEPCSSSFVQCSNGGASHQTCPKGLYFNREERACDYKRNVRLCRSKFGSDWELSQPAPPPFTCTEDGSFSSPNSPPCSTYFVHCDHGVALNGHCHKGRIYEANRKMCVPYNEIPDCAHKDLGLACPLLTSDVASSYCPEDDICIEIPEPTDGQYLCPRPFDLRYGFLGQGNGELWTIALRGLSCSRGKWFDGDVEIDSPAIYCSASKQSLKEGWMTSGDGDKWEGFGGELRVLNGVDAREGQWGSFAEIMMENGANPLHRCGGILIDEETVLTADHCVRPMENMYKFDQWFVLVGGYKFKEGRKYKMNAAVAIGDYTEHKEYDLMLINVSPVDTTLPTPEIYPLSKTAVDENSECYILGMGATTPDMTGNPEKLQVARIYPYRCSDDTRNVKFTDDLTVCTRNPESGVQGCERDSGSPLMCLHDGAWQIQGVLYMSTSMGVKDVSHCDPRGTTFYASVWKHKKWIEENAQILKENVKKMREING